MDRASIDANLYLTGFSFTGKSTVGRAVAERLGWQFLDTDEEIERRAGLSVPDIFSQRGEAAFREMERDVVTSAASRSRLVVSTGGGVVADAANRAAMARSGAVVCLEARPETIYLRLRAAAKASGAVERPLLRDPEPLERIRALKAQRQPFYAITDWTVHTDALTVEEVAEEALRGAAVGWRRCRAGDPLEARTESGESSDQDPDVAYVVQTATAHYPIVVGQGVLDGLGDRLVSLGFAGRAVVVSDEAVFPLHGERALASLRRAGLKADFLLIPPGEGSKTLEQAGRLYDALVERKIERRDVLVALGGGVVGDLGGYVAATYLRGIPYVQVPTTLLAMVDAAIGGKVAVDHPRGKNLVGAFYQPSLVLSDIALLGSLPRRELVAGWAEVVKTGLILDAALFTFLEERCEALLTLEPEAVRHAVARCSAVKGDVVSRDERETTGLRMLLNYGHTLGHALEAATGYSGLLHGEAVAIGMAFAGELSRRVGLLSETELARQNALLERFGLPTRAPSQVDMRAVRAAMSLDKKVQAGEVRWVLLEGIGRATVRADVPQALVNGLLSALKRKR